MRGKKRTIKEAKTKKKRASKREKKREKETRCGRRGERETHGTNAKNLPNKIPAMLAQKHRGTSGSYISFDIL